MEQSRELPLDLLMGVREEMAEIRATVRHLVADLAELRHDVRRLDDRLFQLLLVQLATLVTAFASLVAALTG